MKISPLNKYYFNKSYIIDIHDPNHYKEEILNTLANFWKTVFVHPEMRHASF